jgi:hypothetical protein
LALCHRKNSGIFRKKGKNVWGYENVNLYKNGVGSMFAIHRLVALAFIPNKENKPQVNHKDGIKTNNHVENLEWMTCSENQLHAFKTFRKKQYGEDCSGNKLTRYPKYSMDKQWINNHNKWINRINIINKINDTK